MPEAGELIAGFSPESDLEHQVASDPELVAGLAWGEPRAGHPEGAVGAHVSDLLETIEARGWSGRIRMDLRFVALVHDSFKYRVQGWRPKTGGTPHAARARRFAERYTEEERLLATIELHDRPYNLWRRMQRKGSLDEPAFERMLGRVPDHGLFMQFIEIDGSTEGKNPDPVEWFRAELRRRRVLGG